MISVGSLACQLVSSDILRFQGYITLGIENQAMSLLQIADQTFSLAETDLTAYVGLGENGWRVSWSVEFLAKPKEVNGHEWLPKLSSHDFELDLTPAFTEPLEADLLPSEEGEPAFLLYTFEHEPVEHARLKVSRLQDGTFNLQLTGQAGVFADERYASDLPIRAECNVSLSGVIVDEYHFAKAEERLAQFFDRDLFGPAERHNNGGVVFKLDRADA